MKSNWMRGNTAPIKYRVASKGRALTRQEKVRDILFQRSVKEHRAAVHEAVLKAKAEKPVTRDYSVVQAQIKNPEAKVKVMKNGSLVGRVNGTFVKLAK
jgi:hypothetical protein